MVVPILHILIPGWGNIYCEVWTSFKYLFGRTDKFWRFWGFISPSIFPILYFKKSYIWPHTLGEPYKHMRTSTCKLSTYIPFFPCLLIQLLTLWILQNTPDKAWVTLVAYIIQQRHRHVHIIQTDARTHDKGLWAATSNCWHCNNCWLDRQVHQKQPERVCSWCKWLPSEISHNCWDWGLRDVFWENCWKYVWMYPLWWLV